ncbi:mucin-1-like [Salvia hispanica]|nr:mucin-1-like [Salvia hispanica]
MDPSRLKQLAQTISGSHSKNLGLNNTEFGRVKQVRLSSILQHSLSNNGGSPSPSPSPSQSPMSKPDHHNRHHHHHHHHHHAAPAVSPSPSTASGGSFSGRGSPASTPAPAPAKTEPPCPFGHNNWYPWKHRHSRMAPTAPPVYAPYIAPSQPRQKDTPAPEIAPASAERPSPIASHAYNWPPSPSEHRARPQDVMSITSPAPSPSSAKTYSSKPWILLMFTLVRMALL